MTTTEQRLTLDELRGLFLFEDLSDDQLAWVAANGDVVDCPAGAEVSVEGEPAALPAGVDLAAFRIVQEALANASKHAGGSCAWVVVRYEERAVEVEIGDDGRGPNGTPSSPARSSGHGLMGMHERVALYGGTNEEGRKRNSKYLVNWEAFRRAKAAGYERYDLWGLPNEGITYFKAGWGGREVQYVGSWGLVVDPLGARIFETAVQARATIGRLRRLGGGGGGGAAPSEAA